MNQNNKPKLVVILGPTSSGKTGLAVKLANYFNGEIIGADSRQVYRGMDVGTGKDLKDYGETKYHLIDVADPKEVFNLAEYKKLADRVIDDVHKRGKIPFLVGGSGLYLQAVVDNFQLSETKADLKLRNSLEKLESLELMKILTKLNSTFAKKLEISDQKNKRRLIRYIEINQQKKFISKTGDSRYEVLILGIEKDREELNQGIKKRLLIRLEREDMVDEVKQLHQAGVSWQRLESFGLEYKFVSRYLQEKLTYEEMVEQLFVAIRQFAKRQTTWFKRWEKQGREIRWITDYDVAEQLIQEFLK